MSRSTGAGLHNAEPWIQRLARIGYAAKGVVYVTVGVLAANASQSPAERPEGSRGALETLLSQPFGKAILAVVAVGLTGYVLWRIVQATVDPDGKGSDPKGLAVRAGYGISALLHGSLILAALRLILNGGGGGEDGEGSVRWTATVMAQPLGRWVVGLVGAGVLAFGLIELYRAFATDVSKRLNVSQLKGSLRRRIAMAGRFGLAARGIVFGIAGWFVIRAALQYDAQEAQGLAGALRTLKEQPYGPWLLGIVALGLAAHGLFLFVKARYRTMRAT